jgi:hypothetical protein
MGPRSKEIECSGFDAVHNIPAFIPFSMGVYGCVGRHLTLMAVRMFLVKLLCSELSLEDNSSRMLSKFDFRFVGGLGKKISYRQHRKLSYTYKEFPTNIQDEVSRLKKRGLLWYLAK